MVSRNVVGQCLEIILRPMVRSLLSLGFDARDFVEVSKSVYVDVATMEHGVGDKKATASAVARVTGLTRREVTRLRNAGCCQSIGASEVVRLNIPTTDLGFLEDLRNETRVQSSH